MKKLIQIRFIIVVLLSSLFLQGFLSDARSAFYNDCGDRLYEEENYTEAYEKYKSASELDSGYAYFQLFMMYYEGLGVQKDLYLADSMLKKAVELEYPSAQVLYAGLLMSFNKQKAISLLKLASLKENSEAYMRLAWIYYHGNGVQKDIAKAKEYARLAQVHGYDMNEILEGNRGNYKSTNDRELTRQIQSNLKKMGYYLGKIDGLTGPMTRKAIENFQRDHQIAVDVKISEKVLNQTRKFVK